MGDSSIQGFATEISVPQGGTVHFKIDTDAASYQLEIYRMGYYGGDGARLVATVAAQRRADPAGLPGDASTGLTDCGNWAESASWAVPADRGVGDLLRQGRPFERRREPHRLRRPRRRRQLGPVVPDVGHDLAGLQPVRRQLALRRQSRPGAPTRSPTTGRSPRAGRAPEDWVFNAEYPMVRWLERNGYDVSYFTGVDTDARGAELLEHKGFLSVGHDEYWSGTQRANVEAARNAGVDMAFFSGNEVFWKTRWENNHRTLVTYKETHANAKIDPTSTWTGSWRDPRFSPPADGGAARERPDRHDLHRQRRVRGARGARRRRQAPPVARHVRGAAAARRHRDARRRHRRLRVGRGPGQRLPAAGPGPHVVHDRHRRRQAAGLRLELRPRDGHPQPHAVPRRERRRGRRRRARVRRRAPCSGRGGWTPTTTAAARRRTRRCSRRP